MFAYLVRTNYLQRLNKEILNKEMLNKQKVYKYKNMYETIDFNNKFLNKELQNYYNTQEFKNYKPNLKSTYNKNETNIS